jgi:hypothetical protein
MRRLLGHGQSRKINLASRFAALILIALVFSKVAPTLADENTPAPDISAPVVAPTDSTSPSESSSPSPSQSPSDSASPGPELTPIPSEPDASSSPSVPSGSPSPSASPTPKVLGAEFQNIKINVPAILNIDPRAGRLFFPMINISSPEILLACISSNKLVMDVYQRGTPDSILNGELMVSGDMTHLVMITGTANQVMAVINGGGGLSVSSMSGVAANNQLLMRFTAVSLPTLNSEFCASGAPSNARTTLLRPLGITLDLKKGDIRLKA